ncbi:MAG: hypothetical protein M1269_01110 [Chloroflexi bacterium]|nr:hypothetical protein [Chloroflexota bacterium]
MMENRNSLKTGRQAYWPYLLTLISAILMSWAMWGKGFLSTLDNPLHLAHAFSWLSGPVLKQSWFFGWSLDHYCGYASPQAYNPLGVYIIGLLNLALRIPVDLAYKIMVFISYIFPALALQYYLTRRLGWQAGLLGAFAWLSLKSVYTLNFAGLWAFTLSFGFLFLLIDALEHCNFTNRRSAAWIGLLIALVTLSHIYSVTAAAFFVIIYLIKHLSNEKNKINVLISYGTSVLIAILLTMPYLWTLYVNVFLTFKASGAARTVAGWEQSVTELFLIILGGSFFIEPGSRILQNVLDNIYPLLVIILNIIGIFGIYSYISRERSRKRFSFLSPVLGFMILIFLILLYVHFTAATRGYLMIRFVTYFHFGMICFAGLGLLLLNEEGFFAKKRSLLIILILLVIIQGGIRISDSVWEERVSSRVPVIPYVYQIWDYLKSSPPKNHERIIVQDTYQNIDRDPDSKVRNSHLLAMTNVFTGWPQAGSVDGVPETLKERLLFTEAGMLFDKNITEITPEEIAHGMRDFHITRILSVEPVLESKLRQGHFKLLLKSGPFSIFETPVPSGDIVSFSDPGTGYQEISFTETRINYYVISPAENNVMTLKVSLYPLWKAEIDGVPVKLNITEKALMEISLPRGSHNVVFYFQGKAYWTVVLFLAGLVLLILFSIKHPDIPAKKQAV